ncbi:MAG: 3-oxoacyl-[acyl-carrier-protein] reductase [Myxococcota bacterium]
MQGLRDKIALVTGASRGIGRAIAEALASEGARVVINYAGNEDAARATAQHIVEQGGAEPLLLRFDVADRAAVDAGFDTIKSTLGGLHILVNNAGISRDGLLLRFKDDDWHKTLETNLSGAFYCARAGAKMMTKQRWGRIINISSVVGEAGNAGQVAYASAKAGMIGLTKTLAQELASRSITVNAVTPGYIETDMTAALPEEARLHMVEQVPLRSAGTPQDVAAAVAFLASEGARYVTGHILAVNGGMYM